MNHLQIQKINKLSKGIRYTPIIIKRKGTNQLIHIIPTFFSIFRRSNKKRYRLILSKGKEKIILKTESLKELNSKLGEETVKILENQSIPVLNLIGYGIGYFILPKFHKRIEKQNKGMYLTLKNINGKMKYIFKKEN